MAERKDINAFARSYLALLTDHHTQERYLLEGFAESAQSLGFVMDMGRAFQTRYSEEAMDSPRALLDIIDQIDDPMLLGSAIFSRWRYITHWTDSSLLDDENRAWFITALGRLAELTRPERSASSTLSGDICQVEIISNNRSSGRRPKLGEQYEERLTICSDGTVKLSVANFNADPGGHKVIQALPPIQITEQAAGRLLDILSSHFRYAYEEHGSGTDPEVSPGRWEIILTNTNGHKFVSAGGLGAHFETNGMDLSDLVRRIIGRSQLLVFDGNPDVVHRIEVLYRRGVRNGDTISWITQERLLFDRRAESVEHLLEEAPGKRVRSFYYINGGVSSFLDTFDELSFWGIEGNPPDVIENEDEVNAYEISIYTRHGNNRRIRGTYDRRALPRDWAEFIDKTLTFLGFYGYGELFDAERFGKAKRRRSDYIYARVVFENMKGEYVYLVDDESLQMEDLVMVPLGPKIRLPRRRLQRFSMEVLRRRPMHLAD